MLAISVHGHQVAGKTKFMENYILFFIYTPSKPNNIKNLKDISFYYICLCVGGERVIPHYRSWGSNSGHQGC